MPSPFVVPPGGVVVGPSHFDIASYSSRTTVRRMRYGGSSTKNVVLEPTVLVHTAAAAAAQQQDCSSSGSGSGSIINIIFWKRLQQIALVNTRTIVTT